MTKILIQGIKLHACHGCLKEEAIVGGDYMVDICMEADLRKPAKSDKLEHTMDYVTVYEIVKKEMSIRSKLIEHVAKRMLDKLKKKFPKTSYIEVKVTKLNPPIPGEVERVSVVISE
ncbi:MAG: dihydroneopterin aldolase [Bacteroidetes bacterium]|nr:MAG: dihydroneopterin aldolase [Bacteroidota bacterium]